MKLSIATKRGRALLKSNSVSDDDRALYPSKLHIVERYITINRCRDLLDFVNRKISTLDATQCTVQKVPLS